MTRSAEELAPILEDAFQVLVVDDDPTVLGLLKELVSMVPGCAVITAGRPDEAMAHIISHPVDIVFTDIHMPGVTGIEMLKDMVALDRTPEVIVMTAYPTSEIAQEAMELGAASLLSKPFEDIGLVELELDKCIKKILRQRAAAQEVEQKKSLLSQNGFSEEDPDPLMKISLESPSRESVEEPAVEPASAPPPGELAFESKSSEANSAELVAQTESPVEEKAEEENAALVAENPELIEARGTGHVRTSVSPHPFEILKPVVEIEMRRCDRHKRQFAVGFVELPESLELSDAQSQARYREEQVSRLQKVFRTSDAVFDAEREGLAIVGFECNRAGANVLEFKLNQAGFPYAGLSVYPTNGQTYEELVAFSRSKLQEKRKHKILLLEKEEFFGQIVKNMLTDPRYQIAWEKNYDQAYKTLLEESESIRLMVVSLTKDPQQWELLAKIKQENLVTFPILLFSEIALDPKLRTQLHRLGVRAVVKKGASQEDFLYVVQSFIMQPSVAAMRKNPRALVTLPVGYKVGESERVSSNSFTLSRDGVFIRELNPPPSGSRIEIDLFIEATQPPLRLQGEVIYSVPYFVGVNRIHVSGMAVKFDDLEEPTLAALDKVVSSALTGYLIAE